MVAQFEADSRLADTLKVWIPNGASVAAMNLLELHAVAELVLLSLSIAYTIWRWRRDINHDKNERDEKNL